MMRDDVELGRRVPGAIVSLDVGTAYNHNAPLSDAPCSACAVGVPLLRGVPWSGAITFLSLASQCSPPM